MADDSAESKSAGDVNPLLSRSLLDLVRDPSLVPERDQAHLQVLFEIVEDFMRAPRHRDHLFHAIVITHSTAS